MMIDINHIGIKLDLMKNTYINALRTNRIIPHVIPMDNVKIGKRQ